jgi:hypothetical protein
MPAEVTIVLDTGAFLTESASEVKVGYFETTGPTDITVREDGTVKPGNIKLGKNNAHVKVLHLKPDGSSHSGISLPNNFNKELLRKKELYKTDIPDFNEKAFHCVLQFESGDFESTRVTRRWFKECDAGSGLSTGQNQHTKPIAEDVLVHYKLADGEELKLLRDDGTVLWTSGKVGRGPQEFYVTLLGDPANNYAYYREALNLKGKTCWLPNPDPPPVGGP